MNHFLFDRRTLLSKARAHLDAMIFSAAMVTIVILTLPSVANAQHKIVDDAKRSVVVPSKVEWVFAAGAPAEVLLYTLAPEKLVGRNHLPSAAALEFMPSEFRTPVQIVHLPNADDADKDAELLALKPDLYVDYGDVTEDYVASVVNVQQRTHVPGLIFDGGIQKIAATYRRLGVALGIKQRGDQLAKQADNILSKYHNRLAKLPTVPRVYLACSGDGAIPCLDDERNGEVVKWLGAINVAGNSSTAPTGPVDVATIKSWNPDVIIVSSENAAVRIRNDAAWQSIKAVAEHHVYAPPTLPFAWGPRPPSVNRLPGMMWLAYTLPGRAYDADLFADVRNFYQHLYHVTLSDEQLKKLMGEGPTH